MINPVTAGSCCTRVLCWDLLPWSTNDVHVSSLLMCCFRKFIFPLNTRILFHFFCVVKMIDMIFYITLRYTNTCLLCKYWKISSVSIARLVLFLIGITKRLDKMLRAWARVNVLHLSEQSSPRSEILVFMSSGIDSLEWGTLTQARKGTYLFIFSYHKIKKQTNKGVHSASITVKEMKILFTASTIIKNVLRQKL